MLAPWAVDVGDPILLKDLALHPRPQKGSTFLSNVLLQDGSLSTVGGDESLAGEILSLALSGLNILIH